MAADLDLQIVPCAPADDGEFIRALTRANFYELMRDQWNEARHQQEPRHPEHYRMVRRAGETIGFFAVRDDGDGLYLQTIQLIASARGAGVGSTLMQHIRAIAVARRARAVRLRVLRGNERASRLYERLGYVEVERDEHGFVLELALVEAP